MCTSTFSRLNSDPGNRRCTLVSTEPSGFTHRASLTELDLRTIYTRSFKYMAANKQAYTRTCAMQSRLCGARSGSPQ